MKQTRKKELKELIKRARELDKAFIDTKTGLRVNIDIETSKELENGNTQFTKIVFHPYCIDLRNLTTNQATSTQITKAPIHTEDGWNGFLVETSNVEHNHLKDVDLKQIVRKQKEGGV